jgi:hypothetical protein
MLYKETSPQSFEKEIFRRGQDVLWYSASACYCTSDSGRIDPNCPRCFGRGYAYSLVKNVRRIVSVISYGLNSITFPMLNSIDSINRIFINTDEDIDVASFSGNAIMPKQEVRRGIKVTADVMDSLEYSMITDCWILKDGVVQVDIRENKPTGYLSGCLTEVSSLMNVSRNKEIEVTSFWGDRIYTREYISPADQVMATCKFVKASRFMLSAIDPKLKIDSNIVLQEADAQMTVPGTVHVGRGDMIVLLTGESRDTAAASNNHDEYYQFPYFHISRVLSVEDVLGPITDYTFIDGNKILWGSRVPEKRFTVSFMYHPAFSVLDSLPNLRYSENKLWPKKMLMKKLAVMDIPGKVLKQTDANQYETGLVDDPRKELEIGGLI